MTVPGAARWVEFSEVVEVVNRSAYGDDGVHSREAAETRGEERGGEEVCNVSIKEKEKQSFWKKWS